MVGIGTWSCRVDTLFFSGNGTVKVFDDGGKYGFELKIPGVNVPDIQIKEVNETGNKVHAIVTSSIMPNKELGIDVEFFGDTFIGFLTVPVLGKVKLKDGKRIA